MNQTVIILIKLRTDQAPPASILTGCVASGWSLSDLKMVGFVTHPFSGNKGSSMQITWSRFQTKGTKTFK